MACMSSYSWAICSSERRIRLAAVGFEGGRRRTAHFVYLGLVHLCIPPGIALELLGVHLPLGQEANLQRVSGAVVGAMGAQYDVDGIVDLSVGAELGPDVLVAEQAHLRIQLVAVGAEDAAVQRDGRQQSHGGRTQRLGGAGGGGFGHCQHARDPHAGGAVRARGAEGEQRRRRAGGRRQVRARGELAGPKKKKKLGRKKTAHDVTVSSLPAITSAAMLPTPSTSHVSFDQVYEPAEDSFLLLDTLSAASEQRFLAQRFGTGSAPLVVEVGSGSGVVLAFVARNANAIVGRADVLALAVDISAFACRATAQTLRTALADPHAARDTLFLDAVNSDLAGSLRPGSVDILVFNPPYVPTPALPDRAKHEQYNQYSQTTSFAQDSYLLELSYAGGRDGMETTDRLLAQLPAVLHPERGVAYILLCAQNKPLQVQQRIRDWGRDWAADLVATSGRQAGWEKLQILRVARVQAE